MDNGLSSIIGQRIEKQLSIRGIQQKELAQALGIQANIISYFCSGRRMPNTAQIKRIARLLNCTADYLLGLSDVVTTDITIQEIHKLTGLSENTINSLIEINNRFDRATKEIAVTIKFPT